VPVIDFDFRTGDVLRVSCPFTPAVVTDVQDDYVVVRWPWHQADPEVDWIEWNGDVAIARDDGTDDWANELYRTEPPAEHLRTGESCHVGIPPTIVHVIAVEYFDPPLQTGSLPRPNREVLVLREGISQKMDLVEQGYGLDPDDDIPLEFELVFRPFSFLDLGDDLVDVMGRAWRFDGLWDWHAYDGAGGSPAWPLTLLTRAGREGSPEHRDKVAASTRMGSHAAELRRWRQFARAEPPTLAL
jgi:hypothetical protein